MKYKIVITNNSKSKHKIILFNAILNANEKIKLPNKVELKCFDINDEKKENLYLLLLKAILHISTMARFTKSTDNRKLYFGYMNIFGNQIPLPPLYNSQQEKIDYSYSYWNPKESNVCDSKELVAITSSFFCEIEIEKQSKFEIEFNLIRNDVGFR